MDLHKIWNYPKLSGKIPVVPIFLQDEKARFISKQSQFPKQFYQLSKLCARQVTQIAFF
jgi:hypothetical protein